MNQKTLFIITIIVGALLLVSLSLLVLFGFRLADANKVKETAVTTSLSEQETKLKADFQAEREMSLASYVSDEVFGSFSFKYPKVWSTNVTQDLGSKEQLIFLADPNLIVNNRGEEGPYTALRVKVYSTSYETVVKDIRSKYITKAKTPYTEKDISVSEVTGKRYSGYETESQKNIDFVLLPLRDKTLYIGTDDSSKYLDNLNTILKSFKVTK